MKLICVCLLLFSFCSPAKVSIRLEIDGKSIYECKEATVNNLSPGKGGFKFLCNDIDKASTVYVIYDTSKETANDGTIKEISISSNSETKNLKPAVYSSLRGKIDCARAKGLNRTTGELPFAETMSGDPKQGTYFLEMAEPCGTLAIHIK
jgi:hypothetical protein